MPVYLPEPLAHQQPAYQASCRFKILNCGRRWGKDRLEFTAAVAGHGPPTPTGPLFPGAAQGWTVIWLARDYTQAKSIWVEEFIPRFKPEPSIYTNEGELRVVLPNGGSICIFSDKNVDSIRGLGKKVKGFITNEGAHFDLEYAWLRVVRAILTDNQGWAMLGSTPIAGSYFNQLATEVKTGLHDTDPKTGPWETEWGYWTGTIYDNPTIPDAEADAFIAAMPADSDMRREEGFAELLIGGAALAFPSWNPVVHTCKDFAPPQHWQWVAGMDWGITAKSVVLLAAVDQERRCLLSREWVWRDKDAYTAGYELATNWMHQAIHWPSILWVDSAMAAETGIGGTTLLQEFQGGFFDAVKGTQTPSVAILPAPKGPGSIVAGYNAIRKMLDWGPLLKDEQGNEWLPPSRMPRMRVVREERNGAILGCPYLCQTLPTLRLDEKKQDQPETGGENHAVAALRYLLAGTWPKVQAPEADIPEGKHPGWLQNGQRRSRDRSPETLREEAKINAAWKAQQSGKPVGGRYGPRPR